MSMRLTDPVLAAGGIAAALIALLTLAGMVIRWVRSVNRRLIDPVQQMWLDWRGVPPRDGVPGRPGVMARFASLDARVARIERQVHHNGGSSMRDEITAVRKAVVGEDET